MIESGADAAGVQQLIKHEAALASDLQYWRTKAAALSKKLEQQARTEAVLREEQERLREELMRLAAGEVLPSAAPASPSELIQGPIATIILPELRRARSIVLIPCAVPFDSTLNHRPISCAKYFAGQGATVLFAEVWQTPDQAVHACGEEVYPRIFSIPLYAFNENIHYTLQDNIEAIVSASYARSTYLCTLPTAALVEAARTLRAGGFHIHYDILDDWEEFYRGDQDMTHWFSAVTEREMVVLSDTVSVISEKLREKFDHLRSDISVVRNGYQPSSLGCEQFVAARTPLELPKIVGYFGHLSDAWFDWETVFFAARQLPEIVFEIIGYGLSESSRQRLESFPNVRYIGLVPQKDLHRYARKWWAGMIPFLPSTLSAAVDPLKIYEYLHFGLPAVVTGIIGISGYPLVQFAGDCDRFVAAIRALPDRPDEQSLLKTAGFLKTCVWEERLAKLNEMFLPQDDEPEPAELPGRESILFTGAQYWRQKAAALGQRIEEQARIESDLRAGVAVFEKTIERQARVDTDLRARVAELGTKLVEQRAATSAVEQILQQQAQVEAGLRVRQQQLEAEREAERHKAAALLLHWQSKVEELVRTESELRSGQQRLEEEAARLRAVGDKYAAENQLLASRVAASAYEAANLRRLTSDLLRSRSWKITAPLRFLSKPLFTALAPPEFPEEADAGKEAPLPQPSQQQLINPVLSALRGALSIVVIPCAIPFGSTLNQRPISFARSLADQGSTVIFVVWQWSRDEPVPQAGEEVYPRIFSIPLYTFQDHIGAITSASHGRSSYLCTLPSRGLVDVVHPLRAGGYHIHYDIMDDWEEFQRMGEAPWFSEPIEREMVMLSDTVTAVSDQLARKFEPLRSDIIVLRNGYLPSALACEPFIAARAPLEPPKTIGYFGHLSDGWFDWDTVLYAARKLPEIVFELIGYGLSDSSRARLRDFPNVRFSGVVSQSDLHLHVRKWWAGMIPFRASVLSAAVDPLKIYEYLHFGLPSVVTGITGIVSYPLVQFAADRDSFVSAVENLPGRPDEQTLAAVAEFLKPCVWEERLAVLSRLMNQPAALPSLYAP